MYSVCTFKGAILDPLNVIIQVSQSDLLIHDRWRSRFAFERVTFSPSQKGHQQNCPDDFFYFLPFVVFSTGSFHCSMHETAPSYRDPTDEGIGETESDRWYRYKNDSISECSDPDYWMEINHVVLSSSMRPCGFSPFAAQISVCATVLVSFHHFLRPENCVLCTGIAIRLISHFDA